MASTPHPIILIRHAEKPLPGELGVDEHGHPSADSLSTRGWQRAGALVRWFIPPADTSAEMPRPGALFASRPTGEHPSQRPRQTLEPLAAALQLPLVLAHSSDEVQDAAGTLLQAAREAPVLACWRHDDLPALAQALVGQPVALDWPDDCFDIAWVFEPKADGQWQRGTVLQGLLAGDADLRA